MAVVRLTPSGQVYENAIAFGVARPPRQSTLRFTKSGQVSTVSKQPGDRVTAGERIAGLFQAGVEAEQQALTTRRDAAREELASMTRGVDSFGEGERRNRLEQEIRTVDRRIQELGREADLGWIDAPYNGVVASCSVEVGDMVSAGAAALEVIEDGPPVFEVAVADRVASTLSAGAEAVVRLDAQEVAARIQSVSPSLDPASMTRLVRLTLLKTTEEISWTPGQSVQVRFRMRTDFAGYWLPLSALHGEAGGLWAVYSVVPDEAGGEITRRSVRVLLTEDLRVLVDGSVQSGQLIMSEGIHRVVPGQRVSPVLMEDSGQPTGLE